VGKNKPRTNLIDVARHAGVSPATVSRVLNKTAPVSESVHARVLASLTALDYQPTLARSSSSSPNTIALVVPDLLNPYFSEVVRGVQDEAKIDGFMLLLFDTTEDVQREKQALQALADRSVSGIVNCASRLDSQELIAIRERRKTPMVVINRTIRHPLIPCITVDSENATYRATRHLLDLNHTRVAYLAGPSNSESSQARRRGIEKALGEAGLSLRPEWCPSGFPNVDGGFQAMSAVLALSPSAPPTAAIAYNDIMALGALHAIRTQHLGVPDHISVIGFDDIAMAAHANPPLTTIAQPKYRMGRLAMQILHELIQGHSSLGDGYNLVESPLVVRESTALAPTANGHGPK
jgi:LacI family transcriptional regulator